MKLNLKEKAKKALTYVALVALALNASFVVEMVPVKAVAPPATPEVVINEVMANAPTEWVEVYNPGNSQNMTDWIIEDSIGTLFAAFGPINMSNGDFAVLEKTGAVLNNDGDTVYLKDGAGAVIDSYTYTTDSGAGWTWAAKPDGSEDFVVDVTPTKDASNMTGAPTTPSNLAPINDTYFDARDLTLSWDHSSDPDGPDGAITYEVYIKNLTTSVESSASGLSANSIGLIFYPEGEYLWKVRSVDGAGDFSSWTSNMSFFIDVTAPVVTINTPVDGSRISGEVSIEASIADSNLSHYFLKIEGATSGVVYKSPDDGSGGVSSDEFTKKEILKWDTYSLLEEEYTISLSARDLAGNKEKPGDSYKEVKVTVDNTAPNSTYDSYIDATSPTSNNDPSVYGKFDNSKIVTTVFGAPVITPNYDIKNVYVKFDNGTDVYKKVAKLDYVTGQYSTEMSGDFAIMGSLPTASFLPHGTYNVVAYAYDEAGNYATEVIETALKVDTIAPDEPTNLEVIQKTPTSMKVSWTASTASDVKGYQVSYGTSQGVYTQMLDVGDVTEYTVSGLSPNTMYFFKVTAYDAAMNGSLDSNEVSDTTTEELVENVVVAGVVEGDDEEGKVESAQDEQKEENDDNQEENKDDEEDKDNNSALLWWAIILGLFGGIGYYFYANDPGFLKKLFGGKKGSGPPSDSSTPPQIDL